MDDGSDDFIEALRAVPWRHIFIPLALAVVVIIATVILALTK